MKGLVELDNYYADDYSDLVAPDEDEINAFLADGNTLIISVVRNRSHSLAQRKAKIKWLIDNGADVNKRDCKHRYFPPLTHAIQMNDFQMFIFLLNECRANPNVGSRNPHDAGKLRQKDIKREKNEGNMPLMVAAWDGKVEFVKALCADERTSINQQDANGFTALIKACYWGFLKCRDILLESGADTKIVDIDGLTADDHYNEFLESGRRKPAGMGQFNTIPVNNLLGQNNNYISPLSSYGYVYGESYSGNASPAPDVTINQTSYKLDGFDRWCLEVANNKGKVKSEPITGGFNIICQYKNKDPDG